MSRLLTCGLALLLPLSACQPSQLPEQAAPQATAGREGATPTASTDAVSRALQHAAGRAPDPARHIPQDQALARVRAVEGVSKVEWMNSRDLVVLVNGSAYRNYAMSERICKAMEPLGDTLWVAVHLMDRSARTGGNLTVYSRNCQLPPPEHAVLQDPQP